MKKFLSHLYVFILSSLLLFSDTRYLIASEEEMNLKIENYLYTKIPINCDLMIRKDGEGKLAGIKARGQAVTSSLKILASDPRRAQTAQVDTRNKTRRGAKTTRTTLKIGSGSQSDAGSGANIAV